MDERETVLASTVRDLLHREDAPTAAAVVDALHPGDLAAVLSDLEPDEQAALLRTLPPHAAAEAVWELEESDRVETLEALPDELVRGLVSALPPDGGADLAGSLGEDRRGRVLRALDPGIARPLERLLVHGRGTAGALMTTRFVALPSTASVQEAIDELRRRERTDFVYYVYLLDGGTRLSGATSLREIVVTSPDEPIAAIAHRDLVTVAPETDQEDVARLASRYDLLAVPVVGREGQLVGVVTADDVLEVLSDEAEEDIERFVGSIAERTPAAELWPAVKGRLPWAIGSLAVELPVAWALLRPLPQDVSTRLMAFLPLVLFAASSAAVGAAGGTLRRLASERRPRRLVLRELQAGLLLGAIGAAATAAVLFLAGQDARVVGVVSWSLGIAVFAAAVLGALAPVALWTFRRDPALASGPLVGVLADTAALAVVVLAARLEF